MTLKVVELSFSEQSGFEYIEHQDVSELGCSVKTSDCYRAIILWDRMATYGVYNIWILVSVAGPTDTVITPRPYRFPRWLAGVPQQRPEHCPLDYTE